LQRKKQKKQVSLLKKIWTEPTNYGYEQKHTVDGCEILHKKKSGKHPIIYWVSTIHAVSPTFWGCLALSHQVTIRSRKEIRNDHVRISNSRKEKTIAKIEILIRFSPSLGPLNKMPGVHHVFNTFLGWLTII